MTHTDLLKVRRRNYLEEVENARAKPLSEVTKYFQSSHEHPRARPHHRTYLEDNTPCTLHHQAIKTCHTALANMNVEPNVLDSTFELVRAIHKIPRQPEATDQIRASDCDKVRDVLKCFEDGLQHLRDETVHLGWSLSALL